jgi:hypothetical protein
MKGKVKQKEGKLALFLTPENKQEKKWLLNAFYCISPGVLASNEGKIESLVLWTDNTYELPQSNSGKEMEK